MRNALCIFALFLTASACTPPGKGTAADSGYRFCARINTELENFRGITGRYPDSLAQLSSDSIRNYIMPRRISDIDYQADSGMLSYELTVTYTGPGINHCTYSSESKAWACYGYY